ncbi:hypothetical protein RFI_30370 [Reticulomyxa filosa]|uniref:Uncharacterized protein n=1 Tax=Reticulomyxa filosa TaxID=46433 RepID=X6LYM6_RETFI|nr:hypothetical protein RFI_30370 [Reticulomyxa filosa]|eukprot:ETO07023.1 hypothetical protein RFI_30370 [Reticulomyxa filosa]
MYCSQAKVKFFKKVNINVYEIMFSKKDYNVFRSQSELKPNGQSSEGISETKFSPIDKVVKAVPPADKGRTAETNDRSKKEKIADLAGHEPSVHNQHNSNKPRNRTRDRIMNETMNETMNKTIDKTINNPTTQPSDANEKDIMDDPLKRKQNSKQQKVEFPEELKGIQKKQRIMTREISRAVAGKQGLLSSQPYKKQPPKVIKSTISLQDRKDYFQLFQKQYRTHQTLTEEEKQKWEELRNKVEAEQDKCNKFQKWFYLKEFKEPNELSESKIWRRQNIPKGQMKYRFISSDRLFLLIRWMKHHRQLLKSTYPQNYRHVINVSREDWYNADSSPAFDESKRSCDNSHKSLFEFLGFLSPTTSPKDDNKRIPQWQLFEEHKNKTSVGDLQVHLPQCITVFYPTVNEYVETSHVDNELPHLVHIPLPCVTQDEHVHTLLDSVESKQQRIDVIMSSTVVNTLCDITSEGKWTRSFVLPWKVVHTKHSNRRVLLFGKPVVKEFWNSRTANAKYHKRAMRANFAMNHLKQQRGQHDNWNAFLQQQCAAFNTDPALEYSLWNLMNRFNILIRFRNHGMNKA